EQHAHRGRLAGAVWTDESGERARVDLKGEIVDYDLLAVGLGKSHRPDHFNATPERRHSLCWRPRGERSMDLSKGRAALGSDQRAEKQLDARRAPRRRQGSEVVG